MRTISKNTKFLLHYIVYKDKFLKSDFPENLDFFCTDSDTDEPLTISLRCDGDYLLNRILVLSYSDKENSTLMPIHDYSLDGIYGKSGGIELISEYMLSNFMTDFHDGEHPDLVWVDPFGLPVDSNTHNGIPDRIATSWCDKNELIFNNITYTKMNENNLSLAPDFRNLIIQRSYEEYDDEGYKFNTLGRTRFQYNINQDNLKKWIDDYAVPEFIYHILSQEQKKQLAERLSSNIQWSWSSILRNIFNQTFQLEETDLSNNVARDSWGSDMYSSLSGDGEEDIYMSEGVSLRPDGTLSYD